MSECPFEKVLIPVYLEPENEKCINFFSLLTSQLHHLETEVILLHVISSSGFLSEHMKNIDLRTELLKQSALVRQLKKALIENIVMPLLNKYSEKISKSSPNVKIQKIVLEGEPDNKSIEVALKEKICTLLMYKKSFSRIKDFLIGSVLHRVLYTLYEKNIYVVGDKFKKEGHSKIEKILIPVDGSIYSNKAIKHACCIIPYLKGVKEVVLLRVINPETYEKWLEQGIKPEDEAKEIVERGRQELLKAGVEKELIKTVIKTGNAHKEVVKEIEERDVDVVIIGRKGRSSLKDVVIGSVSAEVLYKCHDPTIVLINL